MLFLERQQTIFRLSNFDDSSALIISFVVFEGMNYEDASSHHALDTV